MCITYLCMDTYNTHIQQADPEGKKTHKTGTLCSASVPTCGSCNSTECICEERGPTDQYPYVFAPFTFCQGQTYCPADGSPCRCNAGDSFECAPAADESDSWLGAHPEWVEEGTKYYSSGLYNDTVGVSFCCCLCGWEFTH